MADQGGSEKARRAAAREEIARYHQDELRRLLERVRDGFVRLDAGEIDEFELDDLIHRYKRSTKKLWVFCSSPLDASSALAFTRDRGEEHDWWEIGATRRERGE